MRSAGSRIPRSRRSRPARPPARRRRRYPARASRACDRRRSLGEGELRDTEQQPLVLGPEGPHRHLAVRHFDEGCYRQSRGKEHMGYAISSLDELGEGYGFRKIRSALGVTAFGANALVMAPGLRRLPPLPRHPGRALLRPPGTARFEVDGETRELGPGIARPRRVDDAAEVLERRRRRPRRARRSAARTATSSATAISSTPTATWSGGRRSASGAVSEAAGLGRLGGPPLSSVARSGDGARREPPARLIAPTDPKGAEHGRRTCRRRRGSRRFASALRARLADRAPRGRAVPQGDVHDQHLRVLPNGLSRRARGRRARRADPGSRAG